MSMSGTQCRHAAIFNRAAAIFIEQFTIEFIPPQVTVRHSPPNAPCFRPHFALNFFLIA